MSTLLIRRAVVATSSNVIDVNDITQSPELFKNEVQKRSELCKIFESILC
jgi:hypothetical protein